MTPRISELVNGPFMLHAYQHLVHEKNLERVNALYAQAVEVANQPGPDSRERAAWGDDDWREFDDKRNEGYLRLAAMFSRSAAKYHQWALDPWYKGQKRSFSAEHSLKLARGFEDFALAVRSLCV